MSDFTNFEPQFRTAWGNWPREKRVTSEDLFPLGVLIWRLYSFKSYVRLRKTITDWVNARWSKVRQTACKHILKLHSCGMQKTKHFRYRITNNGNQYAELQTQAPRTMLPKLRWHEHTLT